MFKNKHVIVALIVAPMLAIGAYFATDYFAGEKPHIAKQGSSYELVAKSNCRYNSGSCVLSNGNFKITLEASTRDDGSRLLALESVHVLDGVKLALIQKNQTQQPILQHSQQSIPQQSLQQHRQSDGEPTDMQAVNTERTRWAINLPRYDTDHGLLRIVVAAGGAVYYGETETIFTKYETVFNEDFRNGYQ